MTNHHKRRKTIENWKNLKETDKYSISNLGNFKNNKTGNLIIGDKNNFGYHRIAFVDNEGKTIRKFRHRLVAEYFVENDENKPQVNHKNGKLEDNRAENLEWCTAKENVRHAYDVLKRTPNGEIKINQIDLKTNKVIKTWKSACEAGRQLGINSRNIITVTKGKRKQAGGFAWEQIK